MPNQDFRARLQPKSMSTTNDQTGTPVNDVLGPKTSSNILYPLFQTRGVIFPYTPAVSGGTTVYYDDTTSFIHSNYGYSAYIRTQPKPISINAEFTAQSTAEAQYLLSVLHFFRSATKSYFGINPYNKAGTPPPVLVFNYLGDYQYNNVPVIIKDFSYTYEASVDYVKVDTSSFGSSSNIKTVSLPPGQSGITWVPTHLSVTLELDTQYTPIKLRNNFDLDKFRSGKLINGGYI